MTKEEKAYELLIASGVWPEVALELSQEYPLDRVKEVVRYIVVENDYDIPGAAIARALRDNWHINGSGAVDRDKVNELLEAK